MCFSETQSYVNALALLAGGILTQKHWRLAASLVFLSLKEYLQGLLYKYQGNDVMLRRIGTLSWIHISFQPFVVNLFMQHFDPKSPILAFTLKLTIFYGLITMTTLKELDIQNDPPCTSNQQMCAQKTGGEMGEYHIAYRFQRDDDTVLFPTLYMLIMFVPALFTKSRPLIILWALHVLAVYAIFSNIDANEQAAIWCFSSILFALPIALLERFHGIPSSLLAK